MNSIQLAAERARAARMPEFTGAMFSGMITIFDSLYGFLTGHVDFHDSIHDHIGIRIGDELGEREVNRLQVDIQRAFTLGLRPDYLHSVAYLERHEEALRCYFVQYAEHETTSELESA